MSGHGGSIKNKLRNANIFTRKNDYIQCMQNINNIHCCALSNKLECLEIVHKRICNAYLNIESEAKSIKNNNKLLQEKFISSVHQKFLIMQEIQNAFSEAVDRYIESCEYLKNKCMQKTLRAREAQKRSLEENQKSDVEETNAKKIKLDSTSSGEYFYENMSKTVK